MPLRSPSAKGKGWGKVKEGMLGCRFC